MFIKTNLCKHFLTIIMYKFPFFVFGRAREKLKIAFAD